MAAEGHICGWSRASGCGANECRFPSSLAVDAGRGLLAAASGPERQMTRTGVRGDAEGQPIRSPGLPTRSVRPMCGRSSVRAFQRRAFGENTRNEYRPVWSVRGDLISCSWQG